MIPVGHGKPEGRLVPWLYLYRTRSGKGWCGTADIEGEEGEQYQTWYYLFPSRKSEGVWKLYTAREGQPPSEWVRICTLRERKDEGLVGFWGAASIVIKPWPPETGRNAKIRAYWSIGI